MTTRMPPQPSQVIIIQYKNKKADAEAIKTELKELGIDSILISESMSIEILHTSV